MKETEKEVVLRKKYTCTKKTKVKNLRPWEQLKFRFVDKDWKSNLTEGRK